MRKHTFRELGGCDERFDFPGGKFMNIDLSQRAANKPDTTVIVLIGEGAFHQVRGGTTTHVIPEDRNAEVQTYEDQYRAIHESHPVYTQTDFVTLGTNRIMRQKFNVATIPSDWGSNAVSALPHGSKL